MTLCELGGKATAWWRGLRNAQKLHSAWDNFVNIFKKQLLPHPFEIETIQNLTFLVKTIVLLKIMLIMLGPSFKNQVSRVISCLLTTYYMAFLKSMMIIG